MEKIKPIDILVITFNRVYFLKRILEEINNRTLYPHRIIVVDSGSTDDTKAFLKRQEKIGRVDKCIFMPENLGQLKALNEGFKHIESELFITTQDDLIPPDLRPCWLERLVHLIEKYPDYGAICMRIQRTRRLEWSEEDDIIENKKSMPSVYRIQRKSDMETLGDRPFGRLKHWESHTFANTMKQLKKKFGMAVHLYADHIGFMTDNKGYVEGFSNYLTYSPERVKQGEDKPYPDIDPKTNIPIKINHGVDTPEHRKKEERKLDKGYEEKGIAKRGVKRRVAQRDLLAQYCCDRGNGIDIGCGPRKVCPNAIGIDLFQYPNQEVDMVGIDGADLWMFRNEELDYIVASHSLEHFVDTKKTLKEWDRVLKRGGILGIIVPDGELRPKTIIEPSHKVALTKPVLRYLLGRFLGYKILVLRDMSELEGYKARECILAVAKKR